MEQLRDENKHLRAQISCLQEENAALRAELERIIAILNEYIKTSGVDPATFGL